MVYKHEQGRMTRMAAFWTLAVLLFYGCHSLFSAVQQWFPEAGLGRPLGGIRIPVLGLDLSPALLIAGVVLAGGLFLLYRWQNKPKNADLLIETEAELKKVTWPTIPEAIGSSVVVIMTVVILMAFLAGTDWVLGRWATYILTGGN